MPITRISTDVSGPHLDHSQLVHLQELMTTAVRGMVADQILNDNQEYDRDAVNTTFHVHRGGRATGESCEGCMELADDELA